MYAGPAQSCARWCRELALAGSVLAVTCAATSFAQDTAALDLCGPKSILVEPDSGDLLVLCERGDAVIRVDAETGAIQNRAATGDEPFALCAGPSGERLYVTCRRGQEVLELDAVSLDTLRRFPVAGDPTGVAVSKDGRRLFVGLHSLDQVAVIDLQSATITKRLAAGNGPQTLRSAPNTGRVYVTNLLSNPTPTDQPARNEITVIDDSTARVVDRIILEGANIGRDIAFSSDGSRAIVAISRPKNLVPMVQVARGWVVTNGFAVVSTMGEHTPMQFLIDLPNKAYADPYGVAITPDDSKFYLTSAGMDTVLSIDVRKLEHVQSEAAGGAIPRYQDHLGLSRRYVTARVGVGANPEAVAISLDGRHAYVANRLDDSISVIDTDSDHVTRTFALSAPRELSIEERGERFFHSAARTLQGQFACASCHPDRGFDGLVYDLEPDGLGMDTLDNRNMRGVEGTAPFKWVGTNPDITTQCGTRTAKWIMRTGWLSSMEVVELSTYIRSIPSVVNPQRRPDGRLTAAQRRGKELYERTTRNDGTPLTDVQRCDFCHPGPKGFDGRKFDVGTQGSRDRYAEFDSAHLNGVFESAPYLHDGRAATLEEIWTKYNLEDKHGYSSDWTKQQLNDLVEYLKSF